MAKKTLNSSMMAEAKRISRMTFTSKRVVRRDLNGSICGESYYPATYFLNLEIENTLEEHPNFDEEKFSDMVRNLIQHPEKENEPI